MSSTEKIIEKWLNPEEIRLRAGEIDPDTMQTVLAVMNGFVSELKPAINDALEEAKAESNSDGYFEGYDLGYSNGQADA